MVATLAPARGNLPAPALALLPAYWQAPDKREPKVRALQLGSKRPHALPNCLFHPRLPPWAFRAGKPNSCQGPHGAARSREAMQRACQFLEPAEFLVTQWLRQINHKTNV